jgi:ribosomal protein S25
MESGWKRSQEGAVIISQKNNKKIKKDIGNVNFVCDSLNSILINKLGIFF